MATLPALGLERFRKQNHDPQLTGSHGEGAMEENECRGAAAQNLSPAHAGAGSPPEAGAARGCALSTARQHQQQAPLLTRRLQR